MTLFDDLKRRYLSLDLLLIDDIQFLAKKDRTQEEFFYVFNSLIENKKQIVITCDTFPKEITGLDDRHGRTLGEQLDHQACVRGVEVGDKDEGNAAVRRHGGEKLFEGLEPTG